MPGKEGLWKLFKKLQERAGVVVSAQELCPFKILDGSHGPHDVSRTRIADTSKDLETADWGEDVTTVSPSKLSADLYLPDAMKLVEPVFFVVAASEWGVQLDLLDVIEKVAIECGLSL
jgi:hypothetical protein